MLASRPCPRTRTQTLAALPARWTTSWPAEFPAPAGPGAADRGAMGSVRTDRSGQAEAARERGLAGVAQQLSARAQHDRQRARVDMEAFDQGLRRRIGVGVQGLAWMAVAGEKA